MIFSRSQAIMALVASGITSAGASVALSNFTPRIENLPQQCQAVYTRPIAGCEAGDFGSNSRCSSSCVKGLVDIQNLVTQACATVDVPETSIIGVFLLGKGIPALCPGVEVTTVVPSASKTEEPPKPSQPAATSTEQAAQSSSAAQSRSAAASSTLATSVVNNPPQPTSTVVQPSAAGTSSSSSKSAKPSSTANSQKSNSESGGGSPFDVQATGAAVPLRGLQHLTAAIVLGVIVLLGAIV